MRRDSKFNWAGRLALALLIAVASVASPMPRAAGAQTATDPETGWTESGGGEAERWWGAAGAVLCGAEIRLIRVAPAIGMNPYVLAAGIGGCVLAMLDVMTTE